MNDVLKSSSVGGKAYDRGMVHKHEEIVLLSEYMKRIARAETENYRRPRIGMLLSIP